MVTRKVNAHTPSKKSLIKHKYGFKIHCINNFLREINKYYGKISNLKNVGHCEIFLIKCSPYPVLINYFNQKVFKIMIFKTGVNYLILRQ